MEMRESIYKAMGENQQYIPKLAAWATCLPTLNNAMHNQTAWAGESAYLTPAQLSFRTHSAALRAGFDAESSVFDSGFLLSQE